MVLLRLTLANLKIIVRNRQSLFWALAFPLILVAVFGVFIQDQASAATTIAVVDHADDSVSQQLIASLDQVPSFEIQRRDDEEQARQEIESGDLGYLLVIPQGLAKSMSASPPANVTLVYDDTNLQGGIIVSVVQRSLDQMNLALAGAPSQLALSTEGVLSSDTNFFDFLLPGLATWGIMSYSVIGLATTMAAYRDKQILKRILATPLKVRVFFIAQVLAYLVMALVQAALILGMGALVFGATIGGNYLYIALLILIGNIVFLNMGFIVGAFSKTVQAASGLGNAVVLPLLFFSGVFFPPDALPVFVKVLIDVLPLAPMLEALRGVTLEGKPLWDFPIQLATMGAWIVITSLVAMKVFRFR